MKSDGCWVGWCSNGYRIGRVCKGYLILTGLNTSLNGLNLAGWISLNVDGIVLEMEVGLQSYCMPWVL